MAALITLKPIPSKGGLLTVLESNIPFEIKRVFFIYGMDNTSRGGHKQMRNREAVVCVRGRCSVDILSDGNWAEFALDSPEKCLLIEPSDWRVLKNFSPDAVLLAVASESYDSTDYIFDPAG